jgi:hypothetical protein
MAAAEECQRALFLHYALDATKHTCVISAVVGPSRCSILSHEPIAHRVQRAHYKCADCSGRLRRDRAFHRVIHSKFTKARHEYANTRLRKHAANDRSAILEF